MKRPLVFAVGFMACTLVAVAQTPTPPGAPAQPVGTISGFAPNPVSGFAPNAVSGFSSSPVGGFTPSPVQGLASTNTFAPADINPLTTTVGGLGNTTVPVAPMNPDLIVTPVAPVAPMNSNGVFSTPLF